jgi:hypothetical protein
MYETVLISGEVDTIRNHCSSQKSSFLLSPIGMMDEDQKKTWALVLEELRKSVTKANYITLFQNIDLVSLENGVATISAPSMMIIDMLQKRFSPLLKESIDLFYKTHVTLLFVPRAPMIHSAER